MKKFFDTPRKAVISAVCIVAFVLAAVALMGAIVLKQSLISKSEAGAAALARQFGF